jgi:DNA polymerase I-like protein with 3'-5' exonuclease and polymerase domains
MEHPNAMHVGQNYNYESQFYAKMWCMKINAEWDTMLIHHILFNYLPKDLAFLASCYCEHYTYWKGERLGSEDHPETRWEYNIKDICYTLEVFYIILDMLEAEGGKLYELAKFQQKRIAPIALKTMSRGVNVNKEEKDRLYNFFSSLMGDMVDKVNTILGLEFNQNSTPQKKKLFTEFFGMELKTKKGGGETCDAKAMLAYIYEYPLYRPFLTLLLEYASLKVFTNNFLGMKLDEDGRARTSYDISGTSTGRWASRKNVWGNGGNFQNIPSKGKIKLKYAVEVMEELEESDESSIYDELEVEGSIILPNIKEVFIPDEGMEIADADLSGADIQIVAADSECKWLLDYFANPKGKVYKYIAGDFFQREITEDEYKLYKGIFHGTNYLMGIDKLAITAGISYELAKDLQDFYFRLNPEIKLWHDRIKKTIAKQGYIENIFGRRGWFLDRNDPMLMNKAAAFIPQGGIADVINHAADRIEVRSSVIEILMQTHDSLTVQYPISSTIESRKILKTSMEVEIPYNPILIIPSDFKVSLVSYGDCAEVEKQEIIVDKRNYKMLETKQLERL